MQGSKMNLTALGQQELLLADVQTGAVGETILKCSYLGCGRESGSAGPGGMHKTIHSRSYTCTEQGCGKVWRNSGALYKHRLTHSCPLKCPEPSCKYHKLGFPKASRSNLHHQAVHSLTLGISLPDRLMLLHVSHSRAI